jgi:hypothetical protein
VKFNSPTAARKFVKDVAASRWVLMLFWPELVQTGTRIVNSTCVKRHAAFDRSGARLESDHPEMAFFTRHVGLPLETPNCKLSSQDLQLG